MSLFLLADATAGSGDLVKQRSADTCIVVTFDPDTNAIRRRGTSCDHERRAAVSGRTAEEIPFDALH